MDKLALMTLLTGQIRAEMFYLVFVLAFQSKGGNK